VKLLLGLLGLLGLTAVGLPLLVVAEVATHPWLAVGMLTTPVQVHDTRPAAVQAGVPAGQWSQALGAAQQSTCHVSPEDLAAIAVLHLADTSLTAVASQLCSQGYGADRSRALAMFDASSFGFADAVARRAATLASPDVVQMAQRWLGVPYVFGGCSTGGVDCSCLVQRVFQALGLNLPRTAAEQYAATARVPRDQLQPGDLVFFADTYTPGVSHVGIYIGGGKQINAPTEGQVVSIQPVFEGYWGAHYFGGGRVLRP
jgi:cell wall-associated NlpC family hydrolase